MSPFSYRAVIFDLGGVVLGSPLHAIRAYERERGLPRDAINRVAADTAPAGAWSRLERGELPLATFYAEFERDCADAGLAIDARAMMERVGASAGPRPAMLEAIRRVRARGMKTAALTNNWVREDSGQAAGAGLRPLFDAFVESSVVGLRKPDPRIYEHVCAALEVEPRRAVFLDDIGRNLKTARALGMATIKVDDPEPALDALEELLGFPLGHRAA